jgi:uncharacterized protein YjiS (DUF1127 family)
MAQHAIPANPNLTYLISRPALPVLAQAFVGVAVLVTKWSLRQRTRKHLRTLPDHLLCDIGKSREDAHYEATLPFWRP